MSQNSDTILAPRPSFDLEAVRADFPVLQRKVNGKPLVYLDNAATAQKPQVVIDAVSHFYCEQNANIHRGVHALSQEATEAYENARKRIATFIGANRPEEVVFVRGATEGFNLLANGLAGRVLTNGTNILLSAMEHHANIVPWQLMAQRHGFEIRVLPMLDEGILDLAALDTLIDEKTRVVSLQEVSNALGVRHPVKEIFQKADQVGAIKILDAAQSVPHGSADFAALGCDFAVFSGHKVYAPTGIGILWGRFEALNELPPWQGGGDMIRQVSWEGTTFKDAPERFEAGTPNIAGALGMAAAIEYLQQWDRKALLSWEDTLVEAATERLADIEGMKIYAQSAPRASVVSFALEGVHPHDAGTFLDQDGIAVRTGHHCCEPLMKRLGVPGTTRASFAFYNTLGEVEALGGAIEKMLRFFR